MIPYDDLVAALSAWRARQGLPVNTIGNSGSGPTPQPGSGPTAKPGSGPNAAKAGSGPNRAPPSPPSASRPGIPVAAAAAVAAEEEVDDSAMLDEEAYENEGNDFAMAFGAGGPPPAESDSTAIGQAPERPTETDMADDRDDW